jgi:hypothetical protein
VGELVKDNYVYASMTELRKFDISDNNIGYGVAPIPNDLSKLQKVEYLCDPTTGRAWQPVGAGPRPRSVHLLPPAHLDSPGQSFFRPRFTLARPLRFCFLL